MKANLVIVVVLAATLLAPAVVAQAVEVSGTWSGSWVPVGGVRDSVTLELKQESNGNLTGKFLTPSPMEFTKASFTPKTGAVVVEAVDAKSGKHFKMNGKVTGNEIKGTLAADNVTGEVLLIKWTFFGR